MLCLRIRKQLLPIDIPLFACEQFFQKFRKTNSHAHDNHLAHSANLTKECLRSVGIISISHPDIVTCDFFPFTTIKKMLQLLDTTVEEHVSALSKEIEASRFTEWFKRMWTPHFT